jgi:hypothetical protein
MKRISVSLAAALLVAGASAPAAAHPGYRVVWDDFDQGWSANAPGARWLNFSVGSFVGDDGLVSTAGHQLSVVAPGVNPVTHLPAFLKTVGWDEPDLTPFDHVKWLAVMNHVSSRGVLGFDAVAGQELVCEATVSGQIFGAHQHPFGNAVKDADQDPRLGAVATSAFDLETFLIFNFLLTNERIYAFYEHPVFARGQYGDYASFIYAIPVAARCPLDRHKLAIAYDKARGRVRWLVDGVEVYRIDALGARPDRHHLLTDRGGADMIFAPEQLDCGMGTFTFLDGYGATGRGLVQVDVDASSYFNPRHGEPAAESFLDATSAYGSRLFGQGAAMEVGRYVIESHPAP